MLDGLAFLPLNDILDGMPFLRTNLPQDPPEAEDLLAYFDRTYVSGQYRPIRQQAAEDVAGIQPLRMRHVAVHPCFLRPLSGMFTTQQCTTTLEQTTSVRAGTVSFTILLVITTHPLWLAGLKAIS